MLLSELIEAVNILEDRGFTDVSISGISTDSRTVKKGDLFIAVKGERYDGHDFVDDAVKSGAAAVVTQKIVKSEVPLIVVRHTLLAEGLLAARYYGNPARDMLMIGITGTNGKTSTAFLLKSILEESFGIVGIIGTVGYGSGKNMFSSQRTTPGASDLNRKLAAFRDEGCRAVVMEVSSHGVVQGRITGVEFDVGIFTNISRDHLDYHKTFKSYLDAKKKFVLSLAERERVKEEGKFVYNADDPVVREIGEEFYGRKVSFGVEDDADIKAVNVKTNLKSTSFDLEAEDETVSIGLNLLGEFSVYNALSAAAASYALDISSDDIRSGLRRVESIPGRFQVVPSRKGPTVVVDYAHTPDALENVLKFCVNLDSERLITVFGCGGDRDRGKRPIMGAIAVRFSDSVYVTTDNPRTEDPHRIIDEILEGIEKDRSEVEVVVDRRDAIRKAVLEAGDNDLVLIAGKGHEEIQIVGRKRFKFSDVSEAQRAIKSREVGYQS
ncbi:MAG TPA: UDP-N-acetylmuramoyl-L-alanyl-D-glutamate--2,6-diaminopimelate ligase [Candidatus Krumholzibacteriaceae bacterium]|nr:UDP-N-acetylmuramoyl-L-alanyl-D-glutamate--2,6-diaminopimelate ligase [Candidatus Krumholzibacteriaceae bacterium]